MSKKLIVAASILGILALGGGAFAVGSALGKPVSADEDYKTANGLLSELKVGKYYLDGGTEDEYLEIYDDGTLQFFGLDYFKMVCELNSDWVATLNEEQYAEFVEAEQVFVDFWNSRHYYWFNERVKLVHLDDELPQPGQIGSKSGFSLSYTDINTLLWDDEHIYKFAAE